MYPSHLCPCSLWDTGVSLSLENERCVGSVAAAGADRWTAPGPRLGPRAVPALGRGGGRVGAGADDGVV